MAPQRQSPPFEKHCGKNMAGERAFPGGERGTRSGRKREPRPLDSAQLEGLALSYVARFATSAAKLERYLAHKLRERGWDGAEEPDLAPLVARYISLGYVDDEAFARARSTSLLRRGYGPRRIGEALGAAGIAEAVREDVRPGEAARRTAALAMARKRRFGPFGSEPLDPARRDKQIAAMLRAGHMLADARALIDAPSVEAAEEWAAASED
jgi:regulatory protein